LSPCNGADNHVVQRQLVDGVIVVINALNPKRINDVARACPIEQIRQTNGPQERDSKVFEIGAGRRTSARLVQAKIALSQTEHIQFNPANVPFGTGTADNAVDQHLIGRGRNDIDRGGGFGRSDRTRVDDGVRRKVKTVAFGFSQAAVWVHVGGEKADLAKVERNIEAWAFVWFALLCDITRENIVESEIINQLILVRNPNDLKPVDEGPCRDPIEQFNQT
jgi:hypothetical protein